MSESKQKKITKAQRFADTIVLLTGEGDIPALEDGAPRTTIKDAVAALLHEIDLLSKKNEKKDSGKLTEGQKKNIEYMALIMDFMASREDTTEGMTCTAIGQSIPELVAEGFGTSKFSSLCNALVAEGKLTKKSVKGKTLFFLA